MSVYIYEFWLHFTLTDGVINLPVWVWNRNGTVVSEINPAYLFKLINNGAAILTEHTLPDLAFYVHTPVIKKQTQ